GPRPESDCYFDLPGHETEGWGRPHLLHRSAAGDLTYGDPGPRVSGALPALARHCPFPEAKSFGIAVRIRWPPRPVSVPIDRQTGSVIRRTDDFAPRPRPQSHQNGRVDLLVQESDAAVAEEHVNAAGVPAEKLVQAAVRIRNRIDRIGLHAAEIW